jgi:phenylpropionate dioxygenase-like ring-hydroxylating dioxygenase large terminal subunit
VLQSGPNVISVPGFDRSKICLTPVRIENFHGFLFANLDPQAEQMDIWFPNARKQLAEWVTHIGQLKPIEWPEIPEDCNWKVSVENYSECYHCTLNHPIFATVW